MAQTIEYNIKINAGGAERTLADIENELNELNEEIKDVGVNSDAFKLAAKNIQVLERELEAVNNEIEGLKFEDKLMAADGAAKFFAGSLSAAVGTLGVLGVESEVFGEFEEKAASAIAVGLGIKDVSEGFVQFSTVMKKSGIAAKLFGSTTSKALIATGVGAFIVLLGSMIAYWDDIKKAVDKAAKAFPFIGQAINFVKDTFNNLLEAARPVLEFLGILPDEAERALMKAQEVNSEVIQVAQRELALLQAQQATAEQIYGARKALLEAELEQLRLNEAAKEEIYAKETELLALNLAEQKRLRDEYGIGAQAREQVQLANAIEARGVKTLEVNDAITASTEVSNQSQLALNDNLIQAQIANQQKLDMARRAGLDNVIALAGEESAVGRAAFIAKQVLAAKELIMEAKNTVTFATLKGAEATAATATGAAKTAAVGFPQNIPLLIAYAVQAAAIITSVVKAVRGAKSAAAEAGAAGGGGAQPSTPRIPTSGPRGAQLPRDIGINPETVAAQQTVRAYVVGGDVTSDQEAEAKLNAKRTLG